MIVSDQTVLLAAAAKAVLRPIGCTQKGKSRTWLDDHQWWVCVIEFQPSSWAKGTYLNVGACWLWANKDFLSFDDGYRVEPFHQFEASEQFESVAYAVAERAKDEVIKVRERFSSLVGVARYLQDKEVKETDIWGHYHAGVSAGLVGWSENARRRLEAAIAADDRDAEWINNLRKTCVELLALIDTPELFRAHVAELISMARGSLKLPQLRGSAF